MTSSFAIEDTSSVSDTKATSVNKINQVRLVQELPHNGKSLPPQQEKAEPAAEQIEQAVAIMNDHVQQIHRQLQFSIDQSSERIVIKVIDSDTDEIIRQIPSEEALNYARKLTEGTALEIFDSFV